MSNVVKSVSVSDMMAASCHFGHIKSYWHPKMLPYIYGTTPNNVHVIDLRKSAPMLRAAMNFLMKVVANKGRVLFVCTKVQASEVIETEARRCGQYFVDSSWRGGMITNFKTVSSSVQKLIDYDNLLSKEEELETRYTKREVLQMQRKRDKLHAVFRGIRDMPGLPNALFVVDSTKEKIAIAEANKVGIPVVAVVDTNSSPEGIDYMIPGNDDSTNAIRYYCSMIANAILSGIEMDLSSFGIEPSGEEAQ